MATLKELRIAAHEIFAETLRAVDAGDAVRSAVRWRNNSLSICDVPVATVNIYAVAIGKAALPMCEALELSLGQLLKRGVLAGPAPNLSQIEWLSGSKWNWYVGGHPLPNQESLAAAADAVGLLQQANRENGLVLFLVSGGGSAMMEWPAAANITLDDLRTANEILVRCGASIAEVNSVRRAFSAVKGGKLSARAPDCDQITLMISDVAADEEFNIASGPTIKPESDAAAALDVINRYQLCLPANIMDAV